MSKDQNLSPQRRKDAESRRGKAGQLWRLRKPCLILQWPAHHENNRVARTTASHINHYFPSNPGAVAALFSA